MQEEERAYSDDGVDLTLIRFMLSLAPAERLDVVQEFMDFVAKVRARNPDISVAGILKELNGHGAETLIAVKEEVGGERDLAALPIKRRTLEKKRRR